MASISTSSQLSSSFMMYASVRPLQPANAPLRTTVTEAGSTIVVMLDMFLKQFAGISVPPVTVMTFRDFGTTKYSAAAY